MWFIFRNIITKKAKGIGYFFQYNLLDKHRIFWEAMDHLSETLTLFQQYKFHWLRKTGRCNLMLSVE